MTAVPSYIRDMERPGALQTIIDDDRIHNVKLIWKHDGAGNWTSEVVVMTDGSTPNFLDIGQAISLDLLQDGTK